MGLWRKNRSRIRAKPNMPTISATTPMLLIMDTNLTPATLMTVQTMMAIKAMKVALGMPIMVAGILGKIAKSGMGIVTETAVTVSTPAKK